MLAKCDCCGRENEYGMRQVNFGFSDGYYIDCVYCFTPISLYITNETIGAKFTQEPPPKVLNKGTVVKFDNRDHVWHNEIAIICDTKTGFYRLELLGKKIWVPQNWVIEHELY